MLATCEQGRASASERGRGLTGDTVHVTETMRAKPLGNARKGYARIDEALDMERFIFNCALRQRIDRYQQTGTRFTFVPCGDQCRHEQREVKRCDRVRRAPMGRGCRCWSHGDAAWERCGLGSDGVYGRWRRTHDGETREEHRPHVVALHQQQSELKVSELRKAFPEYGAFAYQILRDPLRRLDRAYQGFFRRVQTGEAPGFPRFKRDWRSILNTDVDASQYRVEDGCPIVRIKGLPPIRGIPHRPLPDGKPGKIDIVREGRRLELRLTFGAPAPDPLPPTGSVVGIDMGASAGAHEGRGGRLVTSEGKHIPRREPDRRRERRLQRRLSRAQKGGKSRRRAREALARERRRGRIADRNETHRVSKKLVAEHDFIAIEDLAVRNMTRSARGTAEQPGTNVAPKSGLNRTILDQSWGELREQLEYKAAWYGREVEVVDPAYTSQDCSRCGTRNPGATPGREYRCGSCGLTLDRDENAAINIRERGLAQRAKGD